MLLFKPSLDERETLKKAVEKYAHEPAKSELLSHLALENSEFQHATDEWKKLKTCVEQNLLHAQNESRRDPNKKSVRLMLSKADSLARIFNPNFS
jgi:hypothetical protein